MLILACASVVVRVDPNKYLLALKLRAEMFKSVYSSYVDANVIGQCVVYLLLANEILGVENLIRLIAALQGSVDLARRYDIYVCDAFAAILDHFQDFWVAISLHRIANVNVASCLLQVMNIA